MSDPLLRFYFIYLQKKIISFDVPGTHTNFFPIPTCVLLPHPDMRTLAPPTRKMNRRMALATWETIRIVFLSIKYFPLGVIEVT